MHAFLIHFSLHIKSTADFKLFYLDHLRLHEILREFLSWKPICDCIDRAIKKRRWWRMTISVFDHLRRFPVTQHSVALSWPMIEMRHWSLKTDVDVIALNDNHWTMTMMLRSQSRDGWVEDEDHNNRWHTPPHWKQMESMQREEQLMMMRHHWFIVSSLFPSPSTTHGC